MSPNIAADGNTLLPLVSVGILLLIVVFSAIAFYRRERRVKNEIERLKEDHAAELKTLQQQVREETMNYIAAELHDHIGQLLAVVKLNLALHKEPALDETRELISRIIKDLRDLVHSLDGENIAQQELSVSICREVDRLSRLSYTISCHVHSEPYLLSPQKQIGIFRIFQECISNIIKHSAAKNIAVELYFDENLFTLVIRDDGEGFDNKPSYHGLGLHNMEHRARMLGAALNVDTSPGTGCHITLTIRP